MTEAFEVRHDHHAAVIDAVVRAARRDEPHAEARSREQLIHEIEWQKRLTEKVIDALPVSLYVVDRDLKIVAWNRNREVGGQGIDRQHVIGRCVEEVFSRMSRERLIEEFEQVFSSGESLRFEQESVVDGVKRYWQISKIPMRLDGEAGEVTHVVTLGEEITEQKKMNETIIHAEKLAGIGRLASGVVHEINNPLATIAACAAALQSRLSEATELPPEVRADFDEYLKIVHDETFRCKTITNSLLEFSRQKQAEKIEHEMNYLVEQTLQLVRHHPKFRSLRIVRELSDELATVFANEAQMKQVFIAMISNACDAMHENGTLTLRFDAGHAQLTGMEGTYALRQVTLFSLGNNALYHRMGLGAGRTVPSVKRNTLATPKVITPALEGMIERNLMTL